MAYRCSITTKAKLYTQHRYSPSFAYVHSDDEHTKHQPVNDVPKTNDFLRTRSFASSMNTSLGFGGLFQDQRCSHFVSPTMMSGSFLARHMSTNIGEEAGKLDYFTDVADVLTEKTVEFVASQVPAVSEVAIAAADSWFLVAGLQYFIDGIHNLTGLNWWASIVITTLVIRGFTIPIVINQLKATSKLTKIAELQQSKPTDELAKFNESPIIKEGKMEKLAVPRRCRMMLKEVLRLLSLISNVRLVLCYREANRVTDI